MPGLTPGGPVGPGYPFVAGKQPPLPERKSTPVNVPRTLLLGQQAASGGSPDTGAAEEAQSFQFTAVANGFATHMFADFQVSETVTTGEMGIYADDGGTPGYPAALLGKGTFARTSGKTGTFMATLATPVTIVAGTKYHLVWQPDQAYGTAFTVDNQTTLSHWVVSGTTLPNPYPAAQPTGNGRPIIWAEGTQVSGAEQKSINVRAFNGSTDKIQFLGNLDTLGKGGNGQTILLVFKPLWTTGISAYTSIGQSSPAAAAASIYQDAATTLVDGADNPSLDSAAAITGFTTNTWCVLAMTKPAGSSVASFHWKPLGSGSWVHATGAPAGADTTLTLNQWYFAGFGDGSNPGPMQVAVGAVFPRVLTNTELATIEAAATTDAINAASPLEILEFGQASVATAPVGLKGVVTQNSISGTSVTSAPINWAYGISSSNVTVTAPPASATASAPAPTVSIVNNTTPGSTTASGPNPLISDTVVSPPGSLTASAPAPTITVVTNATIVVPPASATLSAPNPTVAGSISSTPGSVTASAPVANVSETFVTTPGSATASGPVPKVASSIVSPASLATASAPAPAISEAVVETPGTITASAPAPTVTITGNVLVTPPPASATASAPAPTVAITNQTTPGSVSANAPVPLITEQVVSGTGSATANAPAPSLTQQITATPGTITASAPDPIAGAQKDATVSVPPASATLSAPAPLPNPGVLQQSATATISAGNPSVAQVVIAPSGTIDASAPNPAVSAGQDVLVTVPSGTTTLSAPAPQMTTVLISNSGTIFPQFPAPQVAQSVEASPGDSTLSVGSVQPYVTLSQSSATLTVDAPDPNVTIRMDSLVSVPPATVTLDAPVSSIDMRVTAPPGDLEANSTQPSPQADILSDAADATLAPTTVTINNDGAIQVGVPPATMTADVTNPTVSIVNVIPEPEPSPGEVVGSWTWGVGGGGAGGGMRHKDELWLDEDKTVEVPPATMILIGTRPNVKIINHLNEQEDEELILMAMAQFGMLGDLAYA